MPTQPLANRLADYAVSLRFDQLPAAVVHEAKRRFLDSIATAVGAMGAEAYAVAAAVPCASRAIPAPVSSAAAAAVPNGRRSSTVS